MGTIWNCDQCNPPGGHGVLAPFESSDGACPTCKRSPATVQPGQRKIRRLAVIHLLLRDDAGTVKLWNEEVGRALGYRLAGDGCVRKDDEYLTGCSEGKPNLSAVTCPACIAAINKSSPVEA